MLPTTPRGRVLHVVQTFAGGLLQFGVRFVDAFEQGGGVFVSGGHAAAVLDFVRVVLEGQFVKGFLDRRGTGATADTQHRVGVVLPGRSGIGGAGGGGTVAAAATGRLPVLVVLVVLLLVVLVVLVVTRPEAAVLPATPPSGGIRWSTIAAVTPAAKPVEFVFRPSFLLVPKKQGFDFLVFLLHRAVIDPKQFLQRGGRHPFVVPFVRHW
jgi:hypothetical protein